jgi:hypothetical protein
MNIKTVETQEKSIFKNVFNVVFEFIVVECDTLAKFQKMKTSCIKIH